MAGFIVRRVGPRDKHGYGSTAVWPDRWRWSTLDGWAGHAITKRGAVRLATKHIRRSERTQESRERFDV